jgi:hypothetical protein
LDYKFEFMRLFEPQAKLAETTLKKGVSAFLMFKKQLIRAKAVAFKATF